MADTATPVAPTTPATAGSVDWSAAFWRGFRGFIGTFLGLFLASAATAFAGLQAVPVNFSQPKQTATALVVAFAVGFFAALGKAIRDKWGNADGSGMVNKLVF